MFIAPPPLSTLARVSLRVRLARALARAENLSCAKDYVKSGVGADDITHLTYAKSKGGVLRRGEGGRR